jgi:hypothetical protein
MLVAKDASALQIPDWVPDHIAARALELRQARADSAIAVDLIERLTTDSRMKRVWSELAKRDRTTKGSLHKVAAKFDSSSVDERAATIGLLEFAFNLGRLTLMLPSADKPARPYKALAQKYHDDAERLMDDPGAQGIRMLLLILAQYCGSTRASAHNPSEVIATEIAHWLKTVFGKSMHGITALITGVITGRESQSAKFAPGWRRRSGRGTRNHTPPKNDNSNKNRQSPKPAQFGVCFSQRISMRGNHMEQAPREFDDDEWLDVPAACALIGGNRPIHPATYYRGVKAGRYPAPEQRGGNVKRVSRRRIEADLRRLRDNAA